MKTELQNIKRHLYDLERLKSEDSVHTSFEFKVDDILKELRSLFNSSVGEEKETYGRAIDALAHTRGKEVYYIKFAQEKTQRAGAAKVRTREYFGVVNEAYDRVKRDLWEVLQLMN